MFKKFVLPLILFSSFAQAGDTITVDQQLRSKIFLACVESIKLKDESSFAGMDDAIKQCDESATSMAVTSTDPFGYYNGHFSSQGVDIKATPNKEGKTDVN